MTELVRAGGWCWPRSALVRVAAWLLAAAGAVYVVATFLPWYRVDSESEPVSGWTLFRDEGHTADGGWTGPWVLTAAAGLLCAALLLRFAPAGAERLWYGIVVLAFGLGAVAVAFVDLATVTFVRYDLPRIGLVLLGLAAVVALGGAVLGLLGCATGTQWAESSSLVVTPRAVPPIVALCLPVLAIGVVVVRDSTHSPPYPWLADDPLPGLVGTVAYQELGSTQDCLMVVPADGLQAPRAIDCEPHEYRFSESLQWSTDGRLVRHRDGDTQVFVVGTPSGSWSGSTSVQSAVGKVRASDGARIEIVEGRAEVVRPDGTRTVLLESREQSSYSDARWSADGTYAVVLGGVGALLIVRDGDPMSGRKLSDWSFQYAVTPMEFGP